jgi:hypothetical protein
MKDTTGTSVFTLFPDGRIHREDYVRDMTTAVITPSACTCGPAQTGFAFTSFWTFDSTLFANVVGPTLGTKALPLAQDVSADLGCLDGLRHHIAVASAAANLRPPTSSTLAFVHDYTPARPEMLTTFEYASTSAIVIDDSCDNALARAGDVALPQELKVNDDRVTLADDGIYGGGVDSGSGYDLKSDRAEITGELAGSFAVQLRFDHDSDALRVQKNGGSVDYIPQHTTANEWLLWFEAGITASDTIVVESL